MNVRICGPNLRDQSKGSFHVHADGCRDLRNYGPGGRFGGDMDGTNEMLVKDATVEGCVLAVYDNGILDERQEDGRTRAEEVNDLVSDLWFAPCCADLPHEDVPDWDAPSVQDLVDHDAVRMPPELVFECWVNGQHGSFVKCSSYMEAESWFYKNLSPNSEGALKPGQSITVGVHLASEYR